MERLRQIEEQTMKAQKGKTFFLILDSKLLLCHQIIYYFLILLNLFYFFNWRKIALQCRTTTWISHNCTCVPSVFTLPSLPSPHPSRSLQSTRLSSLSYLAASRKLFIWLMMVYICWCYFLYLSHPLFPPRVHKSILYIRCLHSFPANRFICTVLGSTYSANYYAMFGFLFLT